MIAFLLTSFSPLAILGAGGLPHVYASGGATLVQQNNAGCFELGSACTSVSVAFSSNVASGDIIVVGIETSQRGDSLAFSSISDSRGFTYTQATNVCDSQPDCAYIYYATATTGGADTITVSLTGGNSIDGTSSADVNIYEVSGVKTTGLGTATGSVSSGSSSASTSSSVAFSTGAFLLAAIATNAGPSLTPGTGYSASSSSTTYGHAEYSTSGVTSPTSFGATFSSSTVWAEAGIALEPLSTTTTSLVCTSSDIDVSSSTGCTATVSGASGSVSGETITFSQTSGTGTVSLSSSTCTLSGTSCSITVTGSTTGTATLQASYPGDTGNLPSSGTSSSLTINSALVAPVISVAPTTINSGSSATLSTTTAFSGGTSTYSCQWLDEPPAGSYANLGSSFACTTLSTPSTSTGSLSTSGTWNFELQVTDSGGAVKTSTAVTVTVSGGSSGPPPSLEEGNVTIYASSHSAGFLLITVTAQISQMQSAPFYEAVLPQYGYLANGTWGYLGYYQGTFGAVSGGQQGLTVTIAVTYNGLTLTGTLTCPAAGKMSSTSFVFGSP